MLRLAVVGAGIMGSNHARVAAALRDTSVAYVVDADLDRARPMAESVGATPAASVAEVLDDIDAAVVAVPTPLHHEVGLELLTAGKACLIEKPIATTLEQADELLAAAEASGATLMVGHVERFNPAVLELDTLLEDIVHVQADRISAFSARVPDDVVLDLMIHDLDIVASIVGSDVVDVSAVGQAVRNTTNDLVTALLTFADGRTAAITASRLGQQKIRQVSITQGGSYVTVDLLAQQVTINRVDHSEFVDERGARYRQTGVVEIPFLEHRGEPLLLELTEFERAALAGDRPRVSGADGRRALELALRVIEATGRG